MFVVRGREATGASAHSRSLPSYMPMVSPVCTGRWVGRCRGRRGRGCEGRRFPQHQDRVRAAPRRTRILGEDLTRASGRPRAPRGEDAARGGTPRELVLPRSCSCHKSFTDPSAAFPGRGALSAQLRRSPRRGRSGEGEGDHAASEHATDRPSRTHVGHRDPSSTRGAGLDGAVWRPIQGRRRRGPANMNRNRRGV